MIFGWIHESLISQKFPAILYIIVCTNTEKKEKE